MTDVETWAVILTGCLMEGEGVFPFCSVHEEDGCPPWNECRWTVCAEALRAAWQAGAESERERFALIANAAERIAKDAAKDPGGYSDGGEGFRWAAEHIRQAIREVS